FWDIIRGTGAPTPIIYNINSDGLANVAGTTEDGAIQRAFDTWMAVTCGGAKPNLVIQRGADYPNRDNGDQVQNGAIVIDTAMNLVYFVIDTAAWEVDHTILAYTNNLSSAAGPTVTADMQINAVDFQWRAADAQGVSSGCAKPAQGADSKCYDVGN